MTIQSQLALLVMVILVLFSIGHFMKNDNLSETLPNPEHIPFWIGAFMMMLITCFYIIKAFTESFKILLGR